MEDCAKKQINTEIKNIFTAALRENWLDKKVCMISALPALPDSWGCSGTGLPCGASYINELPGVWTSV
jgi:hypothetical protein